MIIDGRKIAENIILELKTQKKPEKSLAAILAGDNAQSESFLKQKEKIASQLGIDFRLIGLSGEISEFEVIKEIEKLNSDKSVGGIILQLPLPLHMNRDKIIAAIDFKKDVDALNPKTKLVLPPAVETVKEILNSIFCVLNSKIVAVVGSKGFLVGKPISEWLVEKCKKLILVDIGDDLIQIKEADIVISGTGKPCLIKPELLKDNAVVIDFGYGLVHPRTYKVGERASGKLKGDFLAEGDLKNICYTPTPGGTGPILVAEIFKNFYKLNCD